MDAARETVFNVFYKAFVHRTKDNDQPWYETQLSDKTYAVVKWSFNGQAMQTFQEQSVGQHAEYNVIGQLKVKIAEKIQQLGPVQPGEPKPRVRVTIYISFSPCAGCSDALITFKQRNDVELEVIFPCLYNIRRESCQGVQSCAPHLDLIVQATSNNNTQGLQNMAAAKIILRTFSPDDWISLAAALNVSNDFINRLKEDKRMAGDLRAILPVADPVGVLGDALAGVNLGDNQAGGANQ